MDRVTNSAFLVSLLFSLVVCQFDLSPDLPSHLPSPPKKPDPPPATNAAGNGTTPAGAGLPANPPVPPPQNVPLGPGLIGPAVLPGDLVPFGLNHVILIIVPQFKTKYHKLPHWLESSIKISMPVTVFFDLLEVPPGMFFPAPGGLLPVPFGSPSTFGPPGPFPPPAGPLPPPPIAIDPPMTDGQIGPSYSYFRQKPYLYGNGYVDDPEDVDVDGFDNSYPEEEISRRRRKRETHSNQTVMDNTIFSDTHRRQEVNKIRRTRASESNTKPHKSERATIIPKLEKILNNAGLEGKPCLLRAVCEVHEAPLQHYGLMGQFLTLFFSVSRSIFAESHLPEYLIAEEAGLSGDCSDYYNQCESTMFSWDDNILTNSILDV